MGKATFQSIFVLTTNSSFLHVYIILTFQFYRQKKLWNFTICIICKEQKSQMTQKSLQQSNFNIILQVIKNFVSRMISRKFLHHSIKKGDHYLNAAGMKNSVFTSSTFSVASWIFSSTRQERMKPKSRHG